MNLENRKINIAIVDDHFAIRDGYRILFHKIDFVGKVNTFGTSKELLQEFKREHYDMLLMDIELKGENGLDVCKKLKIQYPKLKIGIISTHHSKQYISDAYKLKLDGYLFKDTESRTVRKALQQMAFTNEPYFDDECLKMIFEQMNQDRQEEVNGKAALTVREKEITRLIASGLGNQAIANKLFIHISTVTTHRQRIMTKLGLHNVAELINYTIKVGLYVPDQKMK